MKNNLKKTIVGLGLSLGMVAATMAVNSNSFGNTVNVQAATKGKIQATLKKGTLTISGKGCMPNKMNYKDNKKIKKVVIKEGVKKLSKNCFYGCKNLKDVYLPKSLKEVNEKQFYGCKKIKTLSIAYKNCKNFETDKLATKVQTVKIRGNVSYIKFLDGLPGVNWKVGKETKKYKSIDGMIYTKDNQLIRVPSQRTNVKISKKCTSVDLASFLYFDRCKPRFLGTRYYLKSVEMPESVKEIVSFANLQYRTTRNKNMVLEKVVVNGSISRDEMLKTMNELTVLKKWDTKDIQKLAQLDKQSEKKFNAFVDELEKHSSIFSKTNITDIFKKNVEVKDGIYILDKEYLYTSNPIKLGNTKDLVIPVGVKIIGKNAFKSNILSCRNVVLPSSVTEIEKGAFSNAKISGIVDGSKATVNMIGKEAFKASTLTGYEGDIKTIGEKAFSGCSKFDLNTFLAADRVHSIGEGAFENIPWKKITLGKKVTKVYANSFTYKNMKDVPETLVITMENSKTQLDTVCNNLMKNVDFDSPAGFEQIKPIIYNDFSSAYEPMIWGASGAEGYVVEVKSCQDKQKFTDTFEIVGNKLVLNGDKEVEYYKACYANKIVPILEGRIRAFKTVDGQRVYSQWSEKVNLHTGVSYDTGYDYDSGSGDSFMELRYPCVKRS